MHYMACNIAKDMGEYMTKELWISLSDQASRFGPFAWAEQNIEPT
jgi:hypothetical protein